jgi:IclR-like helix-turn-helix domain-containing protein
MATKTNGERGTYQIRALERGLDLLEAFTPASPECSVADLATATGLP